MQPPRQDEAALQQRAHLKELVMNRFVSDFGGRNPHNINIIHSQVEEFFNSQKVNEANLRLLKKKVAELCAAGSVAASRSSSQRQPVAGKAILLPNLRADHSANKTDAQAAPVQAQAQAHAAPSVSSKRQPSVKSRTSKAPSVDSRDSKSKSSYTSSRAPRSVYLEQGDLEDEWATLVKLDTELFKKQKLIERMKELEHRRRQQEDLAIQVGEKQRRANVQQVKEKDYLTTREKFLSEWDKKEIEKQEQLAERLQMEKELRDRQVKDQKRRRRQEKKEEQALEKDIVRQIQDDLAEDRKDQAERRENEKKRMQELMKENEQAQKEAREAAERERQEEKELQEEYDRRLQELEQKRSQENKAREERIRNISTAFQDTVLQNQKMALLAEEEKLVKHQRDLEDRRRQEDANRRQAELEHRQQMRQFLAKQVGEKKQREQSERDQEKRQAELWQNDTQRFRESETDRFRQQKETYLGHQSALLKQIEDEKKRKTKNKMTTLELLYNKALMKQAAQTKDSVVRAQAAEVHR